MRTRSDSKKFQNLNTFPNRSLEAMNSDIDKVAEVLRLKLERSEAANEKLQEQIRVLSESNSSDGESSAEIQSWPERVDQSTLSGRALKSPNRRLFRAVDSFGPDLPLKKSCLRSNFLIKIFENIQIHIEKNRRLRRRSTFSGRRLFRAKPSFENRPNVDSFGP